MPWEEVNIHELAKSLGVNTLEIREKQKLIKLIVKTRKAKKISQAVLAKKLGVSQGRVAQIETGFNTSRVSFDVLLNILSELGYEFKIVPIKIA